MRTTLIAVLTFVGVVGIFILYYFIAQLLYPRLADLGLFGDMFGALNALFSGLAFIGVIYAIFLQRKDLELQREELRLTREELSRSAQAQEKSQRSLSRQAESQKVSAKLNGLSAILNYQGARIQEAGSHGHNIREFVDKAKELILEIERLIENK